MDNLFIIERLDRLEKLMIAHKEVLTFEETCDYMGISRSFVYKLTSSGNIPHSKPNGKLIFFEKAKIKIGCYKMSRDPQTKSKPTPWPILFDIKIDKDISL